MMAEKRTENSKYKPASLENRDLYSLNNHGEYSTVKKILVVDDSKVNRQVLCKILGNEYKTVEAENGLEALEILRASDGNFSLILLDVVMPIMDGYEFLEHCSNDPLLSSIPVIVATQQDSDEDEIRALTSGAADYVTKPFKPQIIKHRISNIIKLRETSAIANLFQYDKLTGVYSKEYFYRQARDIINSNPDKKYDIICSDIVSFKLFNDMFGTDAGDRLLKAIGDEARLNIHGKGICGRLGADIFGFICEHRTDYNKEYFSGVVRKINNLHISTNASIKFGIYEITDRNVPLNQMCDRALLAVENVKGKFSEIFALYDDDIRLKMLSQQMITQYMETALQERQFEVYLQPKYNIKNNSISGAEALVRWVHPEKGFMSPGEFVPLFEKSGFITRLDEYVWEETAKTLRGWMDKGMPVVPISVNVSRADIFNSDLPAMLMGIIEKYRLHPSQLHLEITESAYTDNSKQIIETATKLSQMGFVIEMDDFGTGYSSLNMLSVLPIDVLKLDIGFIQSESTLTGPKNILGFIIDLAKCMNLLIIAEGVETIEQVEQLRLMECDYVQGYYFARPMPIAEFEKKMISDSIDQDVIAPFVRT